MSHGIEKATLSERGWFQESFGLDNNLRCPSRGPGSVGRRSAFVVLWGDGFIPLEIAEEKMGAAPSQPQRNICADIVSVPHCITAA